MFSIFSQYKFPLQAICSKQFAPSNLTLFKVLMVLTVLPSFFSCSQGLNESRPDEEATELIAEEAPSIQSVSRDIIYRNEIPYFQSVEEFFSLLDELNELHQNSLDFWTSNQQLPTLYATTSGLNSSNWVVDQENSYFTTFNEYSQEYEAKYNVDLATYRLLSKDGFVIIGDYIGYIATDLQVWTEIENSDALKRDLRNGSKESFKNDKYEVIHDFRKSSFEENVSIEARNNGVSTVSQCPWDPSPTNSSKKERIVILEGDRQQLAWWTHSRFVSPGAYPKRIRQFLTQKSISYKKGNNRYNTRHTLDMHFWIRSYDPNASWSPKSAMFRDVWGKEIERSFAYLNTTVNSENALVEAGRVIVSDWNSSGETRTTHRRMGGLYINLSVCK